MCGVTSEITSPSVRSTRRSTPCVLGCCGPMLTSISSVRTSNSMMVGSLRTAAALLMLLVFPKLLMEQSCSVDDSYDFNNRLTNSVNNAIISKEYLANSGVKPLLHHPSRIRKTFETTGRFPKISDESVGGHWFVSSDVCSYLSQISFGAGQPVQYDSCHFLLGVGEKALRARFLLPARIR